MSDPELLRLRDSIDNIDAALIHMLAERFKCTQAVGDFKAAHGLPPADPGARRADRPPAPTGRKCQAGSGFRGEVPDFIVTEVIRHHEAIAKSRA